MEKKREAEEALGYVVTVEEDDATEQPHDEAAEKPASAVKKDDEEVVEFYSDFPHDLLAKPEYKRLTHDMTFGNEKIITNKGFRPSFGIAEGEIVKILEIPVKVVE